MWKSVGKRLGFVSLCVVGAELLELVEPAVWYEDDDCVYSEWTTDRLARCSAPRMVALLPVCMVSACENVL